MTTRALLSLVALLLFSGAVSAQEEEPAEPVVVPASGPSIRLEGQLQLQVSSTSVDSAIGWDADLRRWRLTAVGEAGNGFTGILQAEFDGSRARVRDAFVDWAATPALTIRAGQFKVPFNAVEMVSSKRLLVIERGARIRGLPALTTSTALVAEGLAGRSRGFMGIARLADERLHVHAGGWLGSGEAAEDDEGKELAARVELAVFPRTEERPRPLLLSLAAITNGYFGEPRDALLVAGPDSLKLDDSRYATAFEAAVEYGAYQVPGLHVLANVISGDNPASFRIESDDLEFARFLGLQAWGEYEIPVTGLVTAVAPAFRIDRYDPDSDAEDDAVLLLTPGLNLYLGRNVKAQVNLDVLVPQDELDSESALRFQSQVLF